MTVSVDDIYKLEVAIRAARNDPYSYQPASVHLRMDIAERILATLIDVHPEFRTFQDLNDTRKIAATQTAGAAGL